MVVAADALPQDDKICRLAMVVVHSEAHRRGGQQWTTVMVEDRLWTAKEVGHEDLRPKHTIDGARRQVLAMVGTKMTDMEVTCRQEETTLDRPREA